MGRSAINFGFCTTARYFCRRASLHGSSSTGAPTCSVGRRGLDARTHSRARTSSKSKHVYPRVSTSSTRSSSSTKGELFCGEIQESTSVSAEFRTSAISRFQVGSCDASVQMREILQSHWGLLQFILATHSDSLASPRGRSTFRFHRGRSTSAVVRTPRRRMERSSACRERASGWHGIRAN